MTACSSQTVLNRMTSDEGYRVSRDVQFDDSAQLGLDVYVPDGARNAPVVVFFYGARWEEGNKESFKFVGQALAARGIVAVLPDYRLYPQVKFPAFLTDSANAVRWTHMNVGRYGGDPNKIVVMGHSAGAYNAAMLALNPEYMKSVGGDRSWIRGLIGLAGPYDFLPITDPDLRDLFGPPEAFDQTQPVLFTDGHNPPTLLLHGEDDEIIPAKNSHSLAKRIERSGGPVETVFYPKMGHSRIISTLATASLAKLTIGESDVMFYVNDFIRRVTSGNAQRSSQQTDGSLQTIVPQQ